MLTSAQIGVAAHGAILDLCLEGVTIPSAGCLFLVDANMSVGHAFDALVLNASSLSIPVFYCGGGADQTCVVTWLALKRFFLAQAFKDGKIKVPRSRCLQTW